MLRGARNVVNGGCAPSRFSHAFSLRSPDALLSQSSYSCNSSTHFFANRGPASVSTFVPFNQACKQLRRSFLPSRPRSVGARSCCPNKTSEASRFQDDRIHRLLRRAIARAPSSAKRRALFDLPDLVLDFANTVKLASDQSAYPDPPCTESTLTPPPDVELTLAQKMEEATQALQVPLPTAPEADPISRPSSTSTQESMPQGIQHPLSALAALSNTPPVTTSSPQPRSVGSDRRYNTLSLSGWRRPSGLFRS